MSAWTNGVWSLLPFMAAIVSWAIGRIVGAIMAKRVAYECREKDIKTQYPLLAAAATRASWCFAEEAPHESG